MRFFTEQQYAGLYLQGISDAQAVVVSQLRVGVGLLPHAAPVGQRYRLDVIGSPDFNIFQLVVILVAIFLSLACMTQVTLSRQRALWAR